MEEVNHRHLLLSEASDKDLLDKNFLVELTPKYAATREGKILFFWVTNLLTRLNKITRTLFLSYDTSIDQNDNIPGLDSGLIQTLTKINNDIDFRVITDKEEIDQPLDATIIVGNPNLSPYDSEFFISVTCEGWWAAISNEPKESLLRPQHSNPIGPIFGATLAVGQVFTYLSKMTDTKYSTPQYFSGYNLKFSDEYTITRTLIDESNPDFPETLNLPDIQIIGAGAVAHSFVNTLSYIENLRVSDFIIIDRKIDTNGDPETIDLSNLNRYIRANRESIGKFKAEFLSDKLDPVQGQIDFLDDGVEDYINSGGKISNVISCVDNNDARFKIQKRLPNYILGGSTYELGLKIELYDLLEGTNCIMCYNEVEEFETDDEVIERLRKENPEELKEMAKEKDVAYDDLVDFLEDPKCGKVNIQSFAENGTTEFSVGFVSVLSGLFLAVQFIQEVYDDYRPILSSDRNILQFPFITHNHTFMKSTPNPQCECMKVEPYREESTYRS